MHAVSNSLSRASNRRIRGIVVFTALCVVAGGSVLAEYLEIAGDPLRIQADEIGSMGVFRRQGEVYMQQYYGRHAKGSVLFLNGADPNFRFGGGASTFTLYNDENERFTPVSHEMPDPWTIRTVFAAGDTGVVVTQTVSYHNGDAYYTLRWDITNNGATTWTDVRFKHGGDTYFAGDDSSQGHWDPVLRMVYLTNPNPEITGIMGLYGGPQSPADHYMEDVYSTVWAAAYAGDLPDTVREDYHDAGYALEWTRETLAPGETWTIVAFEKWTEAGFVQVAAPPDQTVAPGTQIEYTFQIVNLQDFADTFDVTATSSQGWNVAFAVRDGTTTGSVTVAGGGTETVTVLLSVPDDAAPGAEDVLTVTATSQTDPDVQNADSVRTTVEGSPMPDLVISQLQLHRLMNLMRRRRSRPVLLYYAVKNQGGMESGRCHLELYLSKDQVIDRHDRRLTRRRIPPLAPGEEMRRRLIHFRLRKPLPPGTPWYIIGRVDSKNKVDESNEANNETTLELNLP